MKKIRQHFGSWGMKIFAVGMLCGVLLIAAIVLFYPGTIEKEGILYPDPLIKIYVPPEGQQLSPQATAGLVEGFLPRPDRAVRVPILMYHYIEFNKDPKDTLRIKLTVTPNWFERQLVFLRDNGFTAITPNDLFLAIKNQVTLPSKPVILTFDDGYRDFYTDAYPLLKKYQIKATAYVVPDFLDKTNYMFTWQLKEIATESAGLINIGAHTLHHAALTAISSDKSWEEIYGSKIKLESLIGRPVTDFAYPYGLFNGNIGAQVKQAGFTNAVSTIYGMSEGPENLFYLPRIRVGNYTGPEFASRLH